MSNYLDSLAAIPAEVAAARRAHAAAVQRIQTAEEWTDEAKTEQINRLRQQHLRFIGDAQDRAAVLRRGVEADSQHQPGGDVHAQLLTEAHLQRAWNRAVARLEAGGTSEELIELAVATGDLPMLDALRAELPSWLMVQATETRTDLDATTAKQLAKATAAELAAQLDVAEGRVATGERGRRAKQRAELTALWPSVRAELDGAAMDVAGQPLAGERRMSEAYAANEADRQRSNLSAAFNAPARQAVEA